MSEIDDLNKYYKSIENIERIVLLLFWGIAVSSIIMNCLTPKITYDWVNLVLFIMVIIYVILSSFNSLYNIPRVEDIRKKQLLKDSLGVPLTNEMTKGYYNNEFPPSIIRLGMSVFENAHFGKNICADMLLVSRIKTLIFVVILLSSIFYGKNHIELLMIVTQTVFTSEVVIGWIKLEILKTKFESIYNQLNLLFIHNMDENNIKLIACIIDSFASYESAKACAGIKQSSKAFNKLNNALSTEWEEIKKQLMPPNKR